jgi:hypothetical protein
VPNLQPAIQPNDASTGHFHKTLIVDNKGAAKASNWDQLLKACLKPAATIADFEAIDGGLDKLPSHSAPFRTGVTPGEPAARFVSPLAAWTKGDGLGPDPTLLTMPQPPSITSRAIVGELNELYWMALLRDVPFDRLEATAQARGALADINKAYSDALANGETEMAALRDIPAAGAASGFNLGTLFRANLPGEDIGPLVSQFFLHDINYGAQQIIPWMIPYRAGRDYLTDVKTWLTAQGSGYDIDGDPYNQDNDYAKDMSHFEPILSDGRLPRYYIRNMRDLARFVNRDALHQAYFNAALLLLNWNAPPDPMNTVAVASVKRQGGFATLGGPELLAIVSHVASYALRTVWHQKWHVYLRLRPEAYAGLAELNPAALGGNAANLTALMGSKAVQRKYGTQLLPLAYSAGSPAHPSYGAGHACVAGACVTLLKAWFKGDATMLDCFAGAGGIDPGYQLSLKQAADHPAYGTLPDYNGPDAATMTVEGELNKLAANVALGRSMGGVHFRTDNTRSLRLGELVTTIFLSNWVKTYAEKPTFTFNSFDATPSNPKPIQITPDGMVKVGNSAPVNTATLIANYNANGHI